MTKEMELDSGITNLALVQKKEGNLTSRSAPSPFKVNSQINLGIYPQGREVG